MVWVLVGGALTWVSALSNLALAQTKGVNIRGPAGKGEGPVEPRSLSPRRQFLRPQQPRQSLAFSRHRWAILEQEQARVFRTKDFEQVATFTVPGARNLVALTGGSFLSSGERSLARLSPLALRPRLFVAVPRLGATTFFPSPQQSLHFVLHYDGLSTLAQYDLGQLGARFLPVQAWKKLLNFDFRALVQLQDESWVYSSASGLHYWREGEHLGRVVLGSGTGKPWALLRAHRIDEVWVLDEHHATRLELRGSSTVRERWPLPPRCVAAASSGRRWATLSVAEVSGAIVRFQVDVREQQGKRTWQIFFEQKLSSSRQEANALHFAPEIALSVRGTWVAARGLIVEVHDYQLGRRSWPKPESVGKLAPQLQ